MAGQYPNFNDTEFNLWKKITYNLYNRGVALGIAGLNPPSFNDKMFDLQKKATYYSATIAAK